MEELGIEPGPELRELERAILAQEQDHSAPNGAGQALQAHETRRLVTVLFAELVDGGAGADPEVARSATVRSLAPARETIERHEGTAEELPDGRVMGVFGNPVAHEDDALRAVRAAVELRESGLASRIGVETGEALAAGSEVTGEVVRLASRLRETAGEGEIVVGEEVRRLVGEAVRLEPRWDAELTAWSLLEVTSPAGLLRGGRPLVGRADELSELLNAFALAVAAGARAAGHGPGGAGHRKVASRAGAGGSGAR